MFKAIRSDEPPASLASKQYNSDEVVQRLREIFHEKCYLCEQTDLSAPEIEHLEPHEGNEALKYDWNNLYLSCSRCNSIKSNVHKGLLDCCSDEIDVFRSIKCLVPSVPDGSIQISAESHIEDPKVINTVALLQKCFNEKNTALRGITREVLVEKLFEHYIELLKHRSIIVNKRTTPQEKQHAQERIKVMIKVDFEFSAFWRWHVLMDSKLKDLLNVNESIDF